MQRLRLAVAKVDHDARQEREHRAQRSWSTAMVAATSRAMVLSL
jgi:hypothetical protein